MCVSQSVKPEPGVAVTPGRVSSRSGSNPSRAHRLAVAGGGIDSPTLELSNATLASSGARNLQEKISPCFGIFYVSAVGLDLLYTC